MTLIFATALWSAIAFVVLRWDRLPDWLRRTIPRAFLAGAGVCLLGAPLAAGGYSQDVVLYIGGPYAYKVETIERSYAALAAGLAVVFLALFGATRWGKILPGRGPLAQAFKLSLAVIALRVFLEKLGVPPSAAQLVGVIWLAAPLGVYFGVEAGASGRPGRFWPWLLGYAFGLRLVIVVVMTAATLLQLGTHFDNSGVVSYTVLGQTEQVEPRSWNQIAQLVLAPQLLLWPSATIVVGLLFGLPARRFARSRRGVRTSKKPVTA